MGKTKIAVFALLVTLLALVVVPYQTALACEPDDSATKCISFSRRPVRTPIRAVAAAAKPTAVPPAPVQRGGAPADAMDITDAQRSVEPGAQAWYKVGSGDGPQHLEVWIDTYGKEGLGFGVYSPEQMAEGWPTTPPKGRGASNQKGTGHDLFWSGQSPAGGTWYVLVTNHNSAPMQYTIGSNSAQTDRFQCKSYWEWVAGVYTYWTWCH